MISNNSHTLWTEKYRPDTLDNYIGNPQIKDAVAKYIKNNDIPHLLFYGKAGTGKTTVAKIIIKNINCDYIYINASDENSVDNVRNKIKGFASSSGFNDIKIIVLDEADFLSNEAQAALRNLMETYSQTSRFIMTCNYVEKMIEPITSRCQVFKVEPPSMKDVGIHIKKVLDTEGVNHTLNDVAVVVKDFYPDIRKIINYLQQSTDDGKLILSKKSQENYDLNNKIVELLKTSKTNTKSFNEIRQLIADSGVRMFDELYSTLYERSSEYANGKEVMVTIDVAESIYQSSLVVDKEITFMACIAKLIKTISK